MKQFWSYVGWAGFAWLLYSTLRNSYVADKDARISNCRVKCYNVGQAAGFTYEQISSGAADKVVDACLAACGE
jgi:hypothetical protein